MLAYMRRDARHKRESGVAGRLAGREEKLSLGREDGWSMEGARERGESRLMRQIHVIWQSHGAVVLLRKTLPTLASLLHMPLLTRLDIWMFLATIDIQN